MLRIVRMWLVYLRW